MYMDGGTSFNMHTQGTSTTSAPPFRHIFSTSCFGSINPFLTLICSIATVHPYAFQDATSTIISKATQMLNKSSLPGPGLEYANVMQNPRLGNINSTTSLWKTKNNPSRTYCTTVGCALQKCSNHDTTHCYRVGGGIEGQVPWQKAKREKKEK